MPARAYVAHRSSGDVDKAARMRSDRRREEAYTPERVAGLQTLSKRGRWALLD